MQDLCFTDCTKDAGKTISRLMSFFNSQWQEWQGSNSSLAARKLQKLMKEVMPSPSTLRRYVKL